VQIPTYDLFISYSSHDRPWADRVYKDLRRSFPSLNIFWDREAIQAGDHWRTVLTDATVNAKHLLILWSDAAHSSREVSPEIATFEAEVRLNPRIGLSVRREIYIGLQGTPGGGLADRQGFPGLTQFYDPVAADRGIGALNTEEIAASEWKRVIRMIGDAVVQAAMARPVVVAVIVQNQTLLPLLDRLHDLRQTETGPSLDEFLARYNLTWTNVRSRYGSTGLEWHPYGESETIVDLLEDLRVQANSRLNPSYWFRWDYLDLTDQASLARTKDLHEQASIIVVDPVSLFNVVCANAFRGLEKYLREEHSVMVSLAPLRQEGVDWFAEAMKEQAVPVLNDYFEPSIPPVGGFAKCAINVQRISDIERLVRSRLGSFYLAQSKAEARDTTRMAKE